MNRREHMTAMMAMAALFVAPSKLKALENRAMEEIIPEYGLIGQMIAQPGKRAELAAILLEGTGDMPGNMGYVVGEDSANADALWVIEIWQTKDAHAGSLQLPGVQAAIAKGRPMIAGFGERFEFKPLGRAENGGGE
jgi:quinol monooxygenase YgiN